MSAELLPCPMCGATTPWSYISQSCAVIECKCGVKLQDAAVRTMYTRPEVPLALERYITTAPVLDEIGCVWIKPTDAFHVLGHTARWNRRAS